VQGIIPELIILRIFRKHAWSLDTIRIVAAPTTTLRAQVGRSGITPGTQEVSMITLNDSGSKDSVILKNRDDFV
jgi:hypothetical protein